MFEMKTTKSFASVFYLQILNLSGIQTDKPALSYLLEAFQPTKIPDSFLEGIQLNLSPGTSEYLYFGAYSFFEGVLDIGT